MPKPKKRSSKSTSRTTAQRDDPSAASLTSEQLQQATGLLSHLVLKMADLSSPTGAFLQSIDRLASLPELVRKELVAQNTLQLIEHYGLTVFPSPGIKGTWSARQVVDGVSLNFGGADSPAEAVANCVNAIQQRRARGDSAEVAEPAA